MTVRPPSRQKLLSAVLAAWESVRAQVLQWIAKRDASAQHRALPDSRARAAQQANSGFSRVTPARPPVSLGESPTSAAEKPREGADAVKHVGEQAVVGSQRARQLLLDVQRAPSSAPDRPRSVDSNAPKPKIPPGPFRP